MCCNNCSESAYQITQICNSIAAEKYLGSRGFLSKFNSLTFFYKQIGSDLSHKSCLYFEYFVNESILTVAL